MENNIYKIIPGTDLFYTCFAIKIHLKILIYS